jgi:hypothetical protein
MQLVLEIDMDDPNMQNKMMLGIYENEQKLKDLVSPEDYIAIDSLFIKT